MTIRRSTAAPSAVIACVIILLSVVLITVGITYATEPSELPDSGIQSEASADASDSVAGPSDDSSQPPSDSSAGEESTVKPPEESSDTSSAPELGQSIPAMSAGTFNSVGTQYCILYDVTHDAILYSKNSAERAYPASVTKLLTRVGMRAEWTLSGREAVLRARQSIELGDPCRAYIIDWRLPDMNGIEVTRQIRSLNDDTPIIILTAYDWSDIEAEARTDGMDSVTLTACAVAFCKRVELNGYRAGVYFNQRFGFEEFDLRDLQDYELWLAEYALSPSFPYHFDVWQYANDGMLSGVDGPVDLNLAFVESRTAE